MTRKIVYTGSVALPLVAGIFGFEFFTGTSNEHISHPFFLLLLLTILLNVLLFLVLIRPQRIFGIVNFSIAALGIGWLILSFISGDRGIVARAVAPDGTEMCVIETPGGETHQTGFYYRRPGQPWGWFYYEHEDTHWWFGRIRMDPDGKQAVLYRFLSPVAYFNIPQESFTIVRWDRTLSPAQRWMPESWRPEDAVKFATSGATPMETGARDNKPPAQMD